MTKTRHRKQRCILLGSLLILLAFFTGCTHHQQKTSPTIHERHSTQSTLPLVEQQLLTTINHAQKLGPGNPLLLSSVYSLANYYHDRKDYDKAANQYQHALEIKEQISGPNHPDIAAILQRYARVLQDANRPTEAANLLARARAILATSAPLPPKQ